MLRMAPSLKYLSVKFVALTITKILVFRVIPEVGTIRGVVWLASYSIEKEGMLSGYQICFEHKKGFVLDRNTETG